MTDHDRYRFGNVWLPNYADGFVQTGGSASPIFGAPETPPRPRAPIGFRGAAPGPSLDERGKPRVRVKAPSRPRPEG